MAPNRHRVTRFVFVDVCSMHFKAPQFSKCHFFRSLSLVLLIHSFHLLGLHSGQKNRKRAILRHENNLLKLILAQFSTKVTCSALCSLNSIHKEIFSRVPVYASRGGILLGNAPNLICQTPLFYVHKDSEN